MNGWLYAMSLATTLAVFCGCTWRLYMLQRSGTHRRDYVAFIVAAGCYIGIAISMLAMFLRDVERHRVAAEWFQLAGRLSLTMLFIYPWRRRESDK